MSYTSGRKSKMRVLAFVLAFVVTLSAIPISGFAFEYPMTGMQEGILVMQNEHFKVGIGKYGEIYEIRLVGDRFNTNYVMNSENSFGQSINNNGERKNSPGQNRQSHQWMGELIFAWRFKGETEYREVDTNRSAKLRRVEWADAEQSAVRVVYSVDNVAAFEAKQGNPDTYDKDYEIDAPERCIVNFEVAVTYKLEGKAFNWVIDVKNTSAYDIEIGDIGLPMPFAERWTSTPAGSWDGAVGQIYEERAIDHSFTGGDSAYIYATRPSGQGAFLLFAPDVRTGARIEYHDHWIYTNGTDVSSSSNANWAEGDYGINEDYMPEVPERDGPLYQAWTQNSSPGNNGWNNGLNVFYIHSDMIKRTGRGYIESTKLDLAPGASKSYGFNFFPVVGESHESDNQIAREEEMRSILYQNDIIDAVALPGMQIPTNMTGKLALHTKVDIKSLILKCMHEDSPYKAPYMPEGTNYQRGSMSRPAYDLASLNYNALVEECPKTDENTYAKLVEVKEVNGEKYYIYDIKMTCLGHHNLYINYEVEGTPKQTLLQFNSMAPLSDALQAHSEFLVNKTQVTDPESAGYMAYDEWYMRPVANTGNVNLTRAQGQMNRFRNGEWGDDWGYPKGEFLAAKNFYEPVATQIESLDNYLHYAIWEGGGVRQSDFSVDNFLGNNGMQNRGFSYVHVYNTYFYMYKIAKMYPEMVDYREEATTYLWRAFKIIERLYRGRISYWNSGLMGEESIPKIREALLEEGYEEEAAVLDEFFRAKYQRFENQKYPYGSEYAYDNTGEEAVYEMANYMDNKTMMQKVDWKSRACRGIQPVWYYYAVPVTITGENWWNFQYSMSLIGYCLDDWLRFEAADWTPEERAIAQRVNYASKVGNLNSINMGQIDPDPINYGAVAWSFQASKGVRGSKDNWLGGSNIHGGNVMVNGWRNVSGEADLGLYGALQTLSCDVITDPVFGLYSYGGNLTDNETNYVIEPVDGLYKRLNLLDEKVYVEFERDQYRKATVAKSGTSLAFTVRNLTQTEHDSRIKFFGLKPGSYSVAVNGEEAKLLTVGQGDENVEVFVPLSAEEFSEVTVSSAMVSITGPELVTTGTGAVAEYTISAEDMPMTDSVELEFEIDNYPNLTENTVNADGFNFLNPGSMGSKVNWQIKGDKLVGRVVLSAKEVASGSVELLKLSFNVKEGFAGVGDVKLNSVKFAYDAAYVPIVLVNEAVTTEFVKYFSPYDVNKDGVVDLLDISFGSKYVGLSAEDEEWDEGAQIADVSGDGAVDISDLVLILHNYTVPFVV